MNGRDAANFPVTRRRRQDDDIGSIAAVIGNDTGKPSPANSHFAHRLVLWHCGTGNAALLRQGRLGEPAVLD